MKAKRVTWNSCHGAALLLPTLRQMRRRTFMKLITHLWTVVLKWHPKCHCETASTQLSRSYESCTICIYWSVLKSGQLTYCFWLKLLHHDEKPLLQSRRWMKFSNHSNGNLHLNVIIIDFYWKLFLISNQNWSSSFATVYEINLRCSSTLSSVQQAIFYNTFQVTSSTSWPFQNCLKYWFPFNTT